MSLFQIVILHIEVFVAIGAAMMLLRLLFVMTTSLWKHFKTSIALWSSKKKEQPRQALPLPDFIVESISREASLIGNKFSSTSFNP